MTTPRSPTFSMRLESKTPWPARIDRHPRFGSPFLKQNSLNDFPSYPVRNIPPQGHAVPQFCRA